MPGPQDRSEGAVILMGPPDQTGARAMQRPFWATTLLVMGLRISNSCLHRSFARQRLADFF
jgi:hypothetical protein